MARLFDRSASEYLKYDGNPLSSLPFTVHSRFKHGVTNPTGNECIVSIGLSTSGSAYFFVMMDTSGYIWIWDRQSGAEYRTAVDVADGNYHAVTVTVETTGSPETTVIVYIDGVYIGENSNAGSSSVASWNQVGIGALANDDMSPGNPANNYDGDIADTAIWDVILTSTEITIFENPVSPEFVRLQSIIADWDLIRGLNDRVGGYNLTASGTTVSTHPRIIMPYSPRFISVPSIVVGDLSVDVNDSVSLDENIDRILVNLVSVNDTLNITENILALMDNLIVDINDSVVLTENIDKVLESFIVVDDSVSITESIAEVLENLISVNDPLNINESILLSVDLDIDVNETLNISENITITLSGLILNINIFDTLNITENISTIIGDLVVDINESITLNENISVETLLFPNVYDTIAITEFVDIDELIALNVFDSITLVEFLDLGISVLEISVNDITNIAENITIEVAFTLNVYDSINLTENISSTMSDSVIDVYENIAIGEYAKVNNICLIGVNDAISIAENIDITTILVRGEIFTAFSATKPDIAFVGV